MSVETIRIVTGLRAAKEAMAWIGAEAGVFRRHGLDVVFPKLEVGGPEAVAGLIRGDWDFVQTGVVPIAEGVLSGSDPVILLRNHAPTPSGIIMTRREVTNLGQLNGKMVGVLTDAYSGQAGVIARLAIEEAGATASYVGLGTYRNIHSALAAGSIDAGTLPVDFRFLGPDQYGWNAFETPNSSLPTIFATTRRFIATKRGVVLSAVRGLIETMHVFRTRPDVVAPFLARFLDFTDRKAVEGLCDHYAKLLPTIPRPELAEGMREIHDLFTSRYPAARRLQEADIADTSVVDEVERSGFAEQLQMSTDRARATDRSIG